MIVDGDKKPMEAEIEVIISEVMILLQDRTLPMFNTTDSRKNAEMAINTSKYILRRVFDRLS